MRFEDLPLVVGEDRRERAVEDAGGPGRKRGAVLAGVDALSPGLDADQLDARVVEEGGEGADRVRAAADAGDHAGGQGVLDVEELLARLVADHALKVADERRIRRGAGSGAQDVVGRAHVRNPVANGRAHGLLQRLEASLDRLDRRAQELHALDVRRLAAHVLGAHVDDALEVEQRAGDGGRDAVLAGAGLGDHARLAHPLGEERLADRRC